MVKAKKSLGQNFLRDTQVVENILSTVLTNSEDVIMEIGPGEGVLTQELAQTEKRILAVELDDRLIPILERKFETFPNVKIIHGNILRLNIAELFVDHKVSSTRYTLVGNLPYYITSAIIRMFLEIEPAPKKMFFMVQKEVAERIVARPGGMSILSVAVQYYADPNMLFEVPRSSFEPKPNVDSVFLSITPRNKKYSANERKIFFRVVKAGFCARRKKLLNNLTNSLHLDRNMVEECLSDLHLVDTIRPQELSVEQWMKISAYLKRNIQ